VRRGEALAGALELIGLDLFGDAQRDVRPMAAMRPTGQAGHSCHLKPSPQVLDRCFGARVEQQLKRLRHGSPSDGGGGSS
jgi:hypothetical protein